VEIKSPLGKFRLAATEKGLYSLDFPGENGAWRQKVLGPKRYLPPFAVKQLNKAAKLLERYFEGKPVSFHTLRFDLSGLTPFEKKILKTLAKIPSGQLSSYGNLAAKAGFPKASRAVGSVMRKNRLPILLPCHRVIAAGRKWGDYSQGLVWKKRLLALEGVRAI
jgi:methylated-DNA-[protein]-cysteine S-methyltransferase